MNFWNLFNIKRWSFFGDHINPIAQYNTYIEQAEKLNAILKNFALLTVVSTQCRLFSMAKFYVKDSNGEYVNDDDFIKFIKKPNPFQTQSDFLYSFMFNHMMGCTNVWITSENINHPLLRAYVLDNWKIIVPDEIQNYDKLLESNQAFDDLKKRSVKYIYNDGTNKDIPLKNIISIKDLSFSTDWLSFKSRIDSLYKVISNLEHALDSENINIRFSGKFLVSGQQNPDDVNKTPLTNEEKRSIETKVNDKNPVNAVKSMIDINRYVDSVSNIGLGDITSEEFARIATAFGIPEEVIAAFRKTGSTYENQEKAKGSYVDYVLEPIGESLCTSFKNYFKFEDKDILMSWDHLAFMQVFEKEKAEIQEKKANVLEKLLKLNVPLDEINKFLDTDFESKDIKYVERTTNTTGQNNQTS